MQHRLRRLFAAALAIVGFVACAPRASADTLGLGDTVTLQYLGNGSPDGSGTYTSGELSVSGVSLTGYSPPTFTTPVGEFHWGNPPFFPNQQIVNTFCAELTNHGAGALPPVNGTASFRVGDLSELHGLSSTLIPTQVEAIKALYGNNYDFANDRATGTGALAQNFENAAFQLALWEILYDSNYSLSGGNFSLDDGPNDAYVGIKNEAEAMLGNLTGGLANYNASGYEVVALISPSGAKGADNESFQDHITVQPKAVPAPPAFMLAGVGVLALLGRARWNRKTA
jgi:hypothetical protein